MVCSRTSIAESNALDRNETPHVLAAVKRLEDRKEILSVRGTLRMLHPLASRQVELLSRQDAAALEAAVRTILQTCQLARREMSSFVSALWVPVPGDDADAITRAVNRLHTQGRSSRRYRPATTCQLGPRVAGSRARLPALAVIGHRARGEYGVPRRRALHFSLLATTTLSSCDA